MRIKTTINACPEGSICEQCAYTTHLGAYMNSLDITELNKMPHAALGILKNMKEIILRR